MQYKCVPGPGALAIKKYDQMQDAVATYGDIISRECVGGWELHSIVPIQITKKAGLLGKLIAGLSDDNYELNMLIFKKA